MSSILHFRTSIVETDLLPDSCLPVISPGNILAKTCHVENICRGLVCHCSLSLRSFDDDRWHHLSEGGRLGCHTPASLGWTPGDTPWVGRSVVTVAGGRLSYT